MNIKISQKYADSSLYLKANIKTWGGESNRNKNFNKKLYSLFPDKKLKIVDLGCGGGGFIEDCCNSGHDGLGLEGYKLYDIVRPHSWNIIPNNLKSCDITKPFVLSEPADIFTSWEVFEHIDRKDIDGILQNIINNSHPQTKCIFSISYRDKIDEGHININSKEWWLEKFMSFNLKNNELLIRHFQQQWIRNLGDSYYFVLEF